MVKHLVTMCGAAAIAGGVLTMIEGCKNIYRAYQRKCFELEVASDIIAFQQTIIEDLSKENKKKKSESK